VVKELMTSRRFAPLFWTQFFSALNDNFLKQSLVLVCLFKIGGAEGATLGTIAGAVLIAPFFILSAIAGELADKYDKALLARRYKFAEIFAAAFAAGGFALQSVPLLMIALGLYGSIAALFGPIKYGILPDQLKTNELAGGNALIESGTFLAILAGPVAAGWAAARDQSPVIVVVAIMVIAVACWLSSRAIPSSPSSASGLAITRNPWTSTLALIRDTKTDKRIWDGTLIVCWFWLAGAVTLSLLAPVVTQVIGGMENVNTLCMLVFAIGVAIGSMLAARLSHVRPNLALVPLGGVIMGVCCLALAWSLTGIVKGVDVDWLTFATSTKGLIVLLEFAGIAIGGGFFVVPSFAAVQSWAAADKRARVIAVNNVMSAVFIVGASLVVAALQYVGLSNSWLFAMLGVGNFIATYLVLRTWGREGVRDFAGFLFKALFRVEVRGVENIPPAGTRMVIAPNHVSLLDGPLLHAVLPLDAAFAVDTGIATVWWSKPFMKMIRAYKIDPSRPLATRHLVNLVKNGEPLVIFPEGRLTVTGALMKVYDGAAMIADKGDAVVVPVRIEGAQRSTLTYLKPGQIKKALFPKITVTFLPPVKLAINDELRGKARRVAAGAALQDVMINAYVLNAVMDQTLFQGLASAHLNRDTGKPAVEDPLGGSLSYRKLILGAQVLSHKLETMTKVGENVGVLLPNAVGVAVTFFALQTIGRVPAMLNFSAGPANVLSACKAAEVKVVLTSKAFIEKGRLEPLIAALSAQMKIVYLEEVRQTVTLSDKLRGFLDGTKQRVARRANDPAVILFTSGSEGTPKGVVLSHRNILANAAQALARVDANSEDKVFNALPVFHSFGLTGGLMMPLLAGVPVYLYPSPLHYRIIPELIYQTNSTILFGTDTFLAGYARSAHSYDFRSLRLVLAGAEAVKERTRNTYLSRFGLRILEGYGVTETSPVLAMNTPMANKPSTAGRLSPLMEARLDPVEGITEGGRLFVRGPNVMLGYLRAENPGKLETLEGGWHDTGDIVTIDSEGFITIRGRAKRFAKIAGEMVSLSAVETIAAALWPQAQSAVVTVPDPKKGERLVLITTERDATREAFLKQAKASGATELSVPAHILVVDNVPLLGTGKTDYVAAGALAKERFGQVSQAA
jgi:acyl-[acyl-carrier-protein]-phospholipid O-acyltransferase / long-chain-fatty-acid--[acyl-carrier-protein] ligase